MQPIHVLTHAFQPFANKSAKTLWRHRCLKEGIFLLLGVTTGCYRPATVTFDIEVPQMVSRECSELALAAFDTLEGPALHEITVDLAERKITVTYDPSRLANKNIEHALARAGFDANMITADPEARAALPPACR